MPSPSTRSQRLVEMATKPQGIVTPPLPRRQPKSQWAGRRQPLPQRGLPSHVCSAKRKCTNGLQGNHPYVFTEEEREPLRSYAEFRNQQRKVPAYKGGADSHHVKERGNRDISSLAQATDISASLANFWRHNNAHHAAQWRGDSPAKRALSFSEESPLASSAAETGNVALLDGGSKSQARDESLGTIDFQSCIEAPQQDRLVFDDQRQKNEELVNARTSNVVQEEVVSIHLDEHVEVTIPTNCSSGGTNPNGPIDVPIIEQDQDLALLDILNSDVIPDTQGDIVIIPLHEPVQEMTVISTSNQERTIQNDLTGCQVSRKRKRRPSTWKAAEAKRANNLGLEHVSLRGKLVKAKSLRDGCSDSCRQNCKARISEEERESHHKQFWSLGEKSLQWLHISRLVQVVSIEDRNRKTKLEEGETPWRKNSYLYNLYNERKALVQVCQTMFLDTLAISISVVKNALKKQSPDKRGKHSTRRKMSPVLIQSVVDHIKSFPMVESHYCRASTSRRYLDERLNVAKMHRFYLLKHAAGSPDSAKLRQYRDIFNTYFNLGFFKPKKDQCFICIAWNALSAEDKLKQNEQGEKYLQHIQSKITARNQKKEDKAKTREDVSKTRAVCFDLQKVCFLPKTEIGDLFYKCKLACYNFTMFDMTKKKGTCYVWDQTVAGRGADEMSSFVYDFIERAAADGVTELIFWSDSCSAQNKNQFLYTMFYLACVRFNIRIVHRYLEKGHTQMEADSVHARIETKIKHEDIFTPQQWYGHIKSAKVKTPQYQVIEVRQDLVVSFRDLADALFQWKSVPISKIREIVFDSSKPGKITYKCDFNDQGKVKQILKSKPGRPINLTSYQLPLAYHGPIAMKGKLKQHLTWMLEKGYIPPGHQADFTKVLMTDVTTCDEDDDDGVPQEIVPNEVQMEHLFTEPSNENSIDDDMEESRSENVGSASEISDDSDDE